METVNRRREACSRLSREARRLKRKYTLLSLFLSPRFDEDNQSFLNFEFLNGKWAQCYVLLAIVKNIAYTLIPWLHTQKECFNLILSVLFAPLLPHFHFFFTFGNYVAQKVGKN